MQTTNCYKFVDEKAKRRIKTKLLFNITHIANEIMTISKISN